MTPAMSLKQAISPARILLTLTLVLAAVLSAGATAHAFTVGISDQKTGMWQDPRFARLDIGQVRLLVSYDSVLRGDYSRYDAWMRAAHARGADVLLTINHSSDHPQRLPSVHQYRRTVRALRARYPWVHTMSAWNEANHVSQPTYRHPRRAAQYYNAMRQECAGCTIVAADVLDQKNMLPWLAQFKRYAKHPRVWGLHSYQDANHFRPLNATATRQLLRNVRGEVWLTEAGGIVRFGTRYHGGKKAEARAAAAVKHTFRLARMSRRIKRVYLYHWDADPKFITWDSAFVAADGRARPALDVLRRELNRNRTGRTPAVPRLTRFPGNKLPL